MDKKLLFALFLIPLLLLPLNIRAMSFESTDILKHLDKSRQGITLPANLIGSSESLASDLNYNLYADASYFIDLETAHKNGNSGSNAMALSISDNDYGIGIRLPDDLLFLETASRDFPKRIGGPPSFGEKPSAPVPEPATILLFGAGMIALAVIGRKKFLKSESGMGLT